MIAGFSSSVAPFIYSTLSPFSEAAKYYGMKINASTGQQLADGLLIMSQLDSMIITATFIAIYRVLNLATLSLQIRIMNQDWHSGTKFVVNTAVSSLPYIIMLKMGMMSGDLFYADILIKSISFMVKAPYSYYLK